MKVHVVYMIDAPNNPVQRLSIMNNAGINLFHRSFSRDDNLDEHLFSGFTSAILSFTKEMGNDLSSISMKGLDLYFQQNDDIVMVLGIDNEYNNSEAISKVFDELYQIEGIAKLNAVSKTGILEISPDFEVNVMAVLSQLSEGAISNVVDLDLQDNQISERISKYLNDQISAKELAIELIGEDIAEADADKKFKTTTMVTDLLKSANIDRSTRKSLSRLLDEMQKRSNKAAAKANKALF